jgi:hypothetical protein
MRALKTAEEFPFPEDVVRLKMGICGTTWRKYKRLGKVKTLELFGRQYVTPEEYARLLREGTGHNRRTGGKRRTASKDHKVEERVECDP